MLVLPWDSLRFLVSLIAAQGSPLTWDTLTLHLFQNDISPTPETVVGDFDEADFTGYAAEAGVDFGAAYLDEPNLEAKLTIPTVQFSATGGATPNTIYGGYITDAAGTYLYGSQRFAVPIQINSIGDAVFWGPTLGLRVTD